MVICHNFHSYCCHMIFNHNGYGLNLNDQSYKYGAFNPNGKYAIEQVPLPLIISLDYTWDSRLNCGPMWVSQTGFGADKYFFSIQMCFHQQVSQTKISVIFRGNVQQIKYLDNQAYADDVLLLWNNKV